MSQIVISYRRQDSADVTGRIYDHLVRRFGRESVFKDVDAISPGTDFREAIRSAVRAAVVFLAVIGDRWLTVADEEGRRRIDDPNDFVRIEIETALKRDFQLIPLLVRGSSMPTAAELPETIRALSYRHAVPVREDPDFSRDMERLIHSITDVVSAAQDQKREEPTGTEESKAATPSRFMSTPIKEIEEQIKKRLCGQAVAVNQVMPWVKRLRFGLLRDDKPAATFLFVGQSGVGKTLLASELARVVCGDEDSLVIFEMAQYRDSLALPKLVGAPSGYIGYGEGRLVNALRDLPESVLFFDEIEQAGAPVLDLLLRFIDSGFVHDAAGPVRDGRKAIVILATNAGHIHSSEGHQPDNQAQLFEQMVNASRDFLPKELIPRVDEIICFVPFSKAACREIVDIAIDRDMLRLMSIKGIRVTVAENVRKLIAEEFYAMSLHQGARAAPRIVNNLLILPVIDFTLAVQKDKRSSSHQDLQAIMDENGNVCVRATEAESLGGSPNQPNAGDA